MQTMLHLCRRELDFGRLQWLSDHFADPAGVERAVSVLFSYAALARLFSVAAPDNWKLASGEAVDWRQQIRVRVLALRNEADTWGSEANRSVATSLARLALAWCETKGAH